MATALRFPALHSITALSRSTIWRMEKAGKFPRRIQLSDNAVGWLSDEVQKWMDNRIRVTAISNDIAAEVA